MNEISKLSSLVCGGFALYNALRAFETSDSLYLTASAIYGIAAANGISGLNVLLAADALVEANADVEPYRWHPDVSWPVFMLSYPMHLITRPIADPILSAVNSVVSRAIKPLTALRDKMNFRDIHTAWQFGVFPIATFCIMGNSVYRKNPVISSRISFPRFIAAAAVGWVVTSLGITEVCKRIPRTPCSDD